MRPTSEQQEHPRTTISLLIIGGFSCFIAWPLISLLNIALRLQEKTESPIFMFGESAVFVGVFVALFCFMLIPAAKWLKQKHVSIAFLIAMVTIVIATSLLDHFEVQSLSLAFSALKILFEIMNGIVFACLLLLWGTVWDTYTRVFGKSDLRVNLFTSILMGVLICIVTSLIQSEYLVIVTVAVPVISLLLRMILSKQLAALHVDTAALTSVNKVANMPFRHAAYVVTISSYCSFIIFACIGTIGAVLTILTVAVSIIVMCIAMIIYSTTKKVLPRFLLVERVAFPVAFLGSVLVPFLDNTVCAIIAVSMSAMGLSAFMTAHWNLLINWSHRFNLQTIYHYAYGTYTISGGCLLGFVIVLVIRWTSIPDVTAQIVVCLLFLVFTITLSAHMPFDSEGAFNSFEQSATKIRAAKGIWKTVMEDITAEHSLTPREADVLSLLSRGRSIKHISQELYISEHTAKTHVYHIYKKLDINGLQELIDLVDDKMQQAKEDKLIVFSNEN